MGDGGVASIFLAKGEYSYSSHNFGFFSKNEKINNALIRIGKSELNMNFKSLPRFIGVYEHFYNDSIYENISTHYVNLAYKLEIEEELCLPSEQHSEYRWFSIGEILKNDSVHKNVKKYFKD